jgi:surface antigen
MFNAKVSAVKSLMVVGKLLILLSGNLAYANTVDDPRFYSYNGTGFVNRLAEITFGWFKRLDAEQLAEYNQAVTHAVMFAENGQAVRWYRKNASGFAVPVHTWPTGSGYCRRIHIETIAFNQKKTKTATACFRNSHDNWRWVSDK